jgi:phage terminase large subunit-like protein
MIWLMSAGRGYGKTRAGAEWAKWEGLRVPGRRIHIVAPTYSDARDTCVEGDSGLLSVLPHECVEAWNRSLGELILKNGTRYKLFAAEEPNRLRGPQCHAAWCDELSSWRYEDAWDQLIFGLRLGDDPRVCVTTTPKPNPLTRRIMRDPSVIITRGSTFDNAANLAGSALEQLRAKYEGTRLGRQELYAELLEDVPGALWTWEMIRAAQQADTPSIDQMRRVVVAIDPSGSDGETGDSQGIVGAGVCNNGLAHVLANKTLRGSPDEWARAGVRLYDDLQADCIVAERNYGGEMVRRVIQTVRANVPVKLVTATRGKVVRAQPVAALYEQRKVTHAMPFGRLDEQLTQFTGDGYLGEGSPDDADALVWALTELMLTGEVTRRIGVRIGA